MHLNTIFTAFFKKKKKNLVPEIRQKVHLCVTLQYATDDKRRRHSQNLTAPFARVRASTGISPREKVVPEKQKERHALRKTAPGQRAVGPRTSARDEDSVLLHRDSNAFICPQREEHTLHATDHHSLQAGRRKHKQPCQLQARKAEMLHSPPQLQPHQGSPPLSRCLHLVNKAEMASMA